MEMFLQDLRHAARRLLKSPGFSVVAVLTLALGIGANSAIFSVVNGVLLRPLPYPEPGRLVTLQNVWQGQRTEMTPANFFDVRERSAVLDAVASFEGAHPTLTGAGDAVRLQGMRVTDGLFDRVLRVPPALGRTFLPEDHLPGRHRVVILSHGLWQERFGSDPGMVGRGITLHGVTHEVVGVMPHGLSQPVGVQLWMPFEYTDSFLGSRGEFRLNVIGRLAPAGTIEQAQAEADAIGLALEAAYPQSNAEVGIAVSPLHEVTVGDARRALLILLGAVGFVLLIACTNVANLFLAHAGARQGELAVRAALGAGRGRLVRLLLTESLLLAGLGGAAGLVLAIWGTQLLVAAQPPDIPRLNEVSVDGAVVAFTAGISLLTGVVFGLLPALGATRPGLATSLKRASPAGSTGKAGARLRSGLVVAQTAFAVVLLASAGLLVRSFAELLNVDPGFRSEGALSFDLPLSADYPNEAAAHDIYTRLIERLEGLAGVRSVGAIQGLPLTEVGFGSTFHVEGREPAPAGERPSIQIRVATPGLFRALGIPIVRGRAFSDQDRAGAPQVVMISEAAARRHFPNQDPIGQRITLPWTRNDVQMGGEVVGIVGDIRAFNLAETTTEILYLPHAQMPQWSMSLVVRADAPPPSLAVAVREEVAALDPNLAVDNMRTLDEVVSASVFQPRFYTSLLTIFAVLALIIAATGVFGVMSYTVAQRRREIGLRLALGAKRAGVLRLVVGRGMALALMGLGTGLVGALVLTRFLEGFLYGVTPTDLRTYLAVSAVLGLTALTACYLPARRAAQVDPMIALRSE